MKQIKNSKTFWAIAIGMFLLLASPVGSRKTTGNRGNHSGTYFIEGNTIELRYDNGDISRAVFGYDGEKHVVLGSTVYW